MGAVAADAGETSGRLLWKVTRTGSWVLPMIKFAHGRRRCPICWMRWLSHSAFSKLCHRACRVWLGLPRCRHRGRDCLQDRAPHRRKPDRPGAGHEFAVGCWHGRRRNGQPPSRRSGFRRGMRISLLQGCVGHSDVVVETHTMAERAAKLVQAPPRLQVATGARFAWQSQQEQG